MIMANETRELLKKISQTLHEAGWDQPEKPEHPGERSGTSPLFGEMTEEEQAAFWMISAEHMSPEEVAREVDLPEGEVRELYESARRKIKNRAFESLRKWKAGHAGS
jgi:DNA-directed RNA polymerase specialized sigma24 family protein